MDLFNNTQILSQTGKQRPHFPEKSRKWWLPFSIIVASAAIAAALYFWRGKNVTGAATHNDPVLAQKPNSAVTSAPKKTTKSPLVLPLSFTYPTANHNLAQTNNPNVYMTTGTGKLESGLYGLVRTSSRGTPSFHEGIDIAPMSRDRKGNPTDKVATVADGRIAYINAVAGNSNYGIYIVITHVEPIGEFYTLYAHLSAIEPEIKIGDSVARGTVIATMGHTPAHIIPKARGHLHFEIGMVLNSNFAAWYRAQDIKPDHSTYHGHNLAGFNPIALFTRWDDNHVFSLQEHFKAMPVVFTVMLSAAKPIDFFKRYPALWHGREMVPGKIVLGIGDGGVPISGRMATQDEIDSIGNTAAPIVQYVDVQSEEGAKRLLTQINNKWSLSQQGEKLLEILMY